MKYLKSANSIYHVHLLYVLKKICHNTNNTTKSRITLISILCLLNGMLVKSQNTMRIHTDESIVDFKISNVDSVEFVDEEEKHDSKNETALFTTTATNFVGADTISLSVPDIRFNNSFNFWAKVTTMGKLRFSHGDSYSGARLEIDDKNIYDWEYSFNNETSKTELHLVNTIPHGLIISDVLTINVNVLYDGTADVIMSSIGGFFKTNIHFMGSKDLLKVINYEGAYTEVEFNYTCKDLDKPVWIFGDSYLDFWVKYAIEYGMKNAMIDGYSGRDSAKAMISLKKSLKSHCPRTIVWMMGMNDADIDGTVRERWLTTFNELKDICSQYGIELVVEAVPSSDGGKSGAARDHTFKNAIIDSSGYRVLDIRKAVGADISTAWYSGLASGYDIHPSQNGAKVIAAKVLETVPEAF